MEINIKDYLSEEEIKEICIDYVRGLLNKNRLEEERILYNIAYNAAYKIIDDCINEDDLSIIKNKVVSILSKINNYEVFRKKDAWGAEDSIAYIELQKAINENKYLIYENVKKAITEKDYEKEFGAWEDYLGEIVLNALTIGLNRIKDGDI